MCELRIDGAPRGACRCLLGGEHRGSLVAKWYAGLHIADACGGVAGVDGLVVDAQLRLRLWCQGLRVAVEEGVDGVDAVQRGVPGLGALLLQEPALHLRDGDGIVGSEQLHGLDGSHLRGHLVVAPRIAGTLRVVVAAHVLAIDRPLLQALHVGLVLKDDGGEGLLIDGLILRLFLQQVRQVGVGIGHILGQFASVDGADVEPLQGAEGGERLLVALPFFLLHLLHQFHDVVAEV